MKPARAIATVFAAAAATAALAFALALFTPVQAIFTDDSFGANDFTVADTAEATPAEAPETADFETVVSEAPAAAEEAPAAEAAEETLEDAETPAAADTSSASDLVVPRTGASKVRNYQPIMENRSLNVGGHIIGYVDYYEQPSAPTRGAGLWLGEDSTTDGTWGYFIGHNPGDFSGVMDLTEGDAVTVCDSEGLFRTYYVTDTFFVTTETTWQDVESRVSGYGESIILQTCVGDHEHYRVVVAC